MWECRQSLFATAQTGGENNLLLEVNSERKDPKIDLRKAAPYLLIDGVWPSSEYSAVAGSTIAKQFGWKKGDTVQFKFMGVKKSFQITGIIHSGGAEEQQLIVPCKTVQRINRASF